MKRIVFASLLFASVAANATVVGQADSAEGYKVRLTTDRCSVESGRSKQLQWGRTYAYLYDGRSLNGCGVLDNDTVVIEWQTPTGPEVRRYSVDDFTWASSVKREIK